MSSENTKAAPTAAMVAIGDELLNGRTRDANIHHLAGWLDRRGGGLREVRMVPDDQAAIIGALNALRHDADHVFTSGGIGPTHDDITADAVAEAFGVTIGEREDALAVLAEWYAARGEEVTDRRRRMARIPDGAQLIANSVSGAPGFRLGNVFVMAGVPSIFNAMLETLDPVIERGPVYTVFTVIGEGQESQLADGLAALEVAIKGLRIGSYPGRTGKGGPLAIVCKAFDAELARQGAVAVEGLFRARGVQPQIVQGFGRVDEPC
jgi:molybdenum cofactor synthesis domain-containing protein